jgi:hydrogenase small subunit
MNISRRDFLKFCGLSAATMGLSATDLMRLDEALANPSAPKVIWLQGSGCTGCSVSFLNRFSGVSSVPSGPGSSPGFKSFLPLVTRDWQDIGPTPNPGPNPTPTPNPPPGPNPTPTPSPSPGPGSGTAADVLINSVDLIYHPNLMATAGESAVAIAEQAYGAGGFILVVEGGIPTAFGGCACWAWTYKGVDQTFQDVVLRYAAKAAAIVCIGSCASFGGISATPPNPTGVKGVQAVTGKSTVNLSGCPPHPDWVVWAVVQLLLGKTISLDSFGRPTNFFAQTVHSLCPRRGTDEAGTFAVEGLCLRELGCRGPETRANCPNQWFNGGTNWCIGANAPCIGCTESTFPGSQPFYNRGGD